MVPKKRYSLYVKDTQNFKKYKDEVMTLYYKKYGTALSVGDLLIFALSTTKNALKIDSFVMDGHKKRENVVDEYGRIE